MGSLFSKKTANPKAKVSQQDLAVLVSIIESSFTGSLIFVSFQFQQLKQLRDKIKQTQKRISLQIDRDKDVATQLVSDGKKDRALLLLRKKKRMESKMITLDLHLDKLEQMVADIEFAQIEVQLVDGLKVGNDALKELNQLLSVESIESILEETQEAAAKQRELTELLSGVQEGEEDDASLLAELESMVEKDVPVLPAVPQEEPVTEQGDDEETTVAEKKEKPRKVTERTAELAS